MSNTNQNIAEILTADFINQRLDNGGLTVKTLAQELGAKQADVKSVLLSVMGDSIEFRKGRNGGVYRRQTNQ